MAKILTGTEDTVSDFDSLDLLPNPPPFFNAIFIVF
jgi:hypothetical protein